MKALSVLKRKRTDAGSVTLVTTLVGDAHFWSQLSESGHMPTQSASQRAVARQSSRGLNGRLALSAAVCDALLRIPLPLEYQELFLANASLLRFNTGVLQLADVGQFRTSYPLLSENKRRFIEKALSKSNPRLRKLLAYLKEVASSITGEVTSVDIDSGADNSAARVGDTPDVRNPRMQWQDLWRSK